MAKTKQLAFNYFLRVAVAVVERGTGLILVPLLILSVGIEGFGHYSLAASITTAYTSVLTLRLPMAMIRFYPANRKSAGPIVALGLVYWLLLVGLSCTVLLVCGDELAYCIFGSDGRTRLLAASMLVGLCAVLYEFVTVTLRAEVRFGRLSFVDSLERVAFLALVAILTWLGYCSVELVLVLLALALFCKVLCVCGESLGSLKWAWPNRSLVKKSLLFSLPFLPHLAGIWIMERTPFIYLANTAGERAVGLFGVAFSVSSFLLTVLLPIQTVLYPMVKQAHDERREDSVKQLLTTSLRVTLVVGAFGTISLCLGAKHAFDLFSMEAALPDPGLLLIMALAFTATGVRQVMINLVHVHMKTNALIWITSLGAGASMLFPLLLGPSIGIMAAGLGLLSGTLVQILGIASLFPKKLLPLPSPRFMFAVALSAATIVVSQGLLACYGPWHYLVGLALSGVVYAVFLYRFGAISDEEKDALVSLAVSRLPKAVLRGTTPRC